MLFRKSTILELDAAEKSSFVILRYNSAQSVNLETQNQQFIHHSTIKHLSAISLHRRRCMRNEDEYKIKEKP